MEETKHYYCHHCEIQYKWNKMDLRNEKTPCGAYVVVHVCPKCKRDIE